MKRKQPADSPTLKHKSSSSSCEVGKSVLLRGQPSVNEPPRTLFQSTSCYSPSVAKAISMRVSSCFLPTRFMIEAAQERARRLPTPALVRNGPQREGGARDEPASASQPQRFAPPPSPPPPLFSLFNPGVARGWGGGTTFKLFLSAEQIGFTRGSSGAAKNRLALKGSCLV